MKNGTIVLKAHTYKNFSKSIYDASGARELESNSPLRINTPLDCLQNNMLLQPYVDIIYNNRWTSDYEKWPAETAGTRFSCITQHQELPISEQLDYYAYKKNPPIGACTSSVLVLDGKVEQTDG